MTEWKTLNYTWDWTPRLVQVGIWDDIRLQALDGARSPSLRCTGDANLQAKTGA
jgi:hypothetical protein